MQDIDQPISKVINYLREIGAFQGSPVHEKTVTSMKPVIFPQAEWDEYYMTYPYWDDVTREFHKNEFDSIDSKLRRTSYDDVQEQATRDIPDSNNTVIIELGSAYGNKGAGYLAQFKPNARVILISKGWKEDNPPRFLFIEPPKPMHRLVFKQGQDLLNEPDLEKRTNALYKLNGINNVTFYEHELTLDEASENLPFFLRDLKGKEIYLFGHHLPGVLPFLMGKLYDTLNARYMCVSPTAQEKVEPDQFSWEIIQKNLGLNDEELEGLITSTFDPKAKAVKGSFSDKYDYENPAQKRIGLMIKLGVALALAKEINGAVLRNEINPFGYNKIDYYVEAKRF